MGEREVGCRSGFSKEKVYKCWSENRETFIKEGKLGEFVEGEGRKVILCDGKKPNLVMLHNMKFMENIIDPAKYDEIILNTIIVTRENEYKRIKRVLEEENEYKRLDLLLNKS